MPSCVCTKLWNCQMHQLMMESPGCLLWCSNNYSNIQREEQLKITIVKLLLLLLLFKLWLFCPDNIWKWPKEQHVRYFSFNQDERSRRLKICDTSADAHPPPPQTHTLRPWWLCLSKASLFPIWPHVPADTLSHRDPDRCSGSLMTPPDGVGV